MLDPILYGMVFIMILASVAICFRGNGFEKVITEPKTPPVLKLNIRYSEDLEEGDVIQQICSKSEDLPKIYNLKQMFDILYAHYERSDEIGRKIINNRFEVIVKVMYPISGVVDRFKKCEIYFDTDSELNLGLPISDILDICLIKTKSPKNVIDRYIDPNSVLQINAYGFTSFIEPRQFVRIIPPTINRCYPIIYIEAFSPSHNPNIS